MDEEKRYERKKAKLGEIQKDFEECKPCQKGVVIRTARDVCKTADILFNKGICDQLHEKAVLEELPLDDYLSKMRGLCSKDGQAKSVIQALLDAQEP